MTPSPVFYTGDGVMMLVNKGTETYKSGFVNSRFAQKQIRCNVCQIT